MAAVNWRTINIDALDPDSPANFDLSTLTPAVAPVSTADVQSLAGQIRQLLRGGDSEGALRGALENPPYGADERGKVGAITHARSCLRSISAGDYRMSLRIRAS
jgi:actin related protein 2/3 complex, subunit 5